MNPRILLDAIERCHRGDWNGAHALVNADESDPLAMRVHAWLHRIEGDLGNARHWYRKAGTAPFSGTTEAEAASLRDEIGGVRST
jgi:hypothetical protein